MQRKFRVTGFTRFFLVMIVVAPLAYLAASYYNGEDGVANLKRLLGIDKSAATEERFVPSGQPEYQDEQEMEEALDAQQKRLQELKAENERLKKEIREKEEELSKLQNQ
jgi:cell division protein FtsB